MPGFGMSSFRTLTSIMPTTSGSRRTPALAKSVWFYPTQGSGGQPTRSVKYNILLDSWDFGTLRRTAWIDESVLGPPIGACGLTQLIFQHETSTDADGSAMTSYFQTGYFVLTEANEKMFIDQIWPDMKWGYDGGSQGANVTITFFVTDYPGQYAASVWPVYDDAGSDLHHAALSWATCLVRLESNDAGSFWRIGNVRYRFQPDGRY